MAKSNEGTISSSVKGTYTYNPPSIVILVSSDGRSVSLTMTVKGNTIEFISDGETYLYKKK